MLQFIIGLIIGGMLGFGVCAICSMAKTDDRTDAQCTKKIGKDDAEK